MNETIQNHLIQLFEDTFNEKVNHLEHIPAAASDRRYVRLSNENRSVMGAYNPKRKENTAFIAFSKHFEKINVAVPRILAERLDDHIYLVDDLGDETLLQVLKKESTKGATFPERVLNLYKKAVQDLAYLQIKGDEGLDYDWCSESQTFDKQNMIFDMNAFQFHFLKMAGIDYDIEKLGRDFKRLANYLTKEDGYNFFMFRDFQSRNIMIKDEKPHYIDFQSGRKGALQYDLASLIYQAKADLPQEVREELTDVYIEAVGNLIDIDPEQFRKSFYAFVLLRTMQVLSTYGYRGFYQRKAHFLTSIPYAINNIEWLLENNHVPKRMPELKSVIKKLIAMENLRTMNDKYPSGSSNLKVTISSFSYKRGIPQDNSGHGGGFVFDCRSLNNPGRHAEYRKLTGRDESVQQFLETNSKMPDFLENVYALVDRAVKNYIDREFSHLMVSFGCTGGQHRSVYSADRLAEHLKSKFDITVEVNHVEQELKNWVN